MSSVKSKRIVFILPSFAGGGAERVLITLMNGLEGYDRSFIAVSDDGPLRDLINNNISVHTLGHGLRASHSVFKLYAKLKILRPDIVVSTMAHMNFVLLLLRPFFPKTKFIVREAITPSFFFQGKGLKELMVWLGYKLLYPLADTIISPAQVIIDEFQKIVKVNIKNHVFLPNPVDVSRLRSKKVEPLATSGKRVKFICSGRLHPQKGFDRLIEILPKLKTDWHLTILGEGEQKNELISLINSKGLEDRVTLQGFVDHPWSLIGAADAFLLPSRYEGLPNVVLEALACGTPVIAIKDAGGVEEIAGQVRGNDLRVVDTMDNFIQAMQEIRPQNHISEMRTSLLPELYMMENVIKKFAVIVDKDLK